VSTVLGLLGVAVFIPAIIGLAAAVSWVVVKLSPSKSIPKSPPPPADAG
jgi:hypothetical protein